MLRLAAQAPCRLRPLSSNVRQHECVRAAHRRSHRLRREL